MISINEIIDIIGMTLFTGVLFADTFRKPKITPQFEGIPDIKSYNRFNWEDIKYAAMIIAPGIILHELAHKFTALALGNQATFMAFYRSPSLRNLGFFALLMKFMGFGFIFLVPGFVVHSRTDPLSSAIISISGPLVHLLFWQGSIILLKNENLRKKIFGKKKLSQSTANALFQSGRINKFLLIFNLLPIPFLGTDGYQFLRDIIIVIKSLFG
ncbi:M50 family metallopeptidase [archaeon]|jgi:Zn-dependent protease|nr:M50 family metallopeptidase [archaeon]MBT4351731.1 M50 family metallopeptidase [archaeon]MBT4646760.1 M50 family metallopeptidase [archaeon]MBT6822053.1 M50 family metallopeptidase [archaeon]MBT7391439.1 M50 family metallopeptidase [archaeon]